MSNLFSTSARPKAWHPSAWLLLNFPLLGLRNVDTTVLGVPLFPAALMSFWALLIVALAWLMQRHGAADTGR